MSDQTRLCWIATPTRDGKVHWPMMNAVNALQVMAATGRSRGWSFAFRPEMGSPNIPRQRNWNVARALTTGADVVLFIDSDIAPKPEEILDLLDRPEEVIGVSHQTRPRLWSKPANMAGRFDEEYGKKPSFEHDRDLLRVVRPTTACLAVKASAFAKIREAGLVNQFIAWAVPPESWPHLFDYFVHSTNSCPVDEDLAEVLESVGLAGDKALAMDGEDWHFARLCEKAGVEMWIEPLNSLVHYEGCTGMDVDLHNFWVQHQTAFRTEYLTWLTARADRGCLKALRRLAEAREFFRQAA